MSGPAAPLWRWSDPVEPVAELVARGGLLGIPTESSYGLAVDPRNRRAVEAVYRVKGRDGGKPLPVVLGEAEQLTTLGGNPADPVLSRLARAWPAPLSVIAPIARPLPAAPGGSVAVRVPAHDRLRDLLRRVGPLTATSANLSGEAPLLEAGPLCELLAGEDALVVDGGPLEGGPPSTLVAYDDGGRFSILRQGSYPLERLRSLAAGATAGPPRARAGRRTDRPAAGHDLP